MKPVGYWSKKQLRHVKCSDAELISMAKSMTIHQVMEKTGYGEWQLYCRARQLGFKFQRQLKHSRTQNDRMAVSMP